MYNMHYWGEKNFDWQGLENATTYIAKNLKRFGRVSVRDYKEKYGSSRIYCSLGWYSLLNITHPGYCHYRPYPRFLMTLDIFFLSKIIPVLFNWIVLPYHKWLYRKLYKDMVCKYPHLRVEITCIADFPELLKGI